MTAATMTTERGSWSPSYRFMLFVALAATALALAPSFAHIFELPNKIGLPRDAYLAVQQLYRGWAMFGALIAIQALAIVTVAIMARSGSKARRYATLAVLALAASQAVFWTLTYPVNVATQNWTAAPENWESLRQQWEYSHVAGGACQALVFVFLALAALSRRRVPDPWEPAA